MAMPYENVIRSGNWDGQIFCYRHLPALDRGGSVLKQCRERCPSRMNRSARTWLAAIVLEI